MAFHRTRQLCVTGIGSAAAVVALATLGAAPASAAPAPHVDTKHRSIVIDIPRGESWTCLAVSNVAPFMVDSPGYMRFATWPSRIVFDQFPHGSHVWVECNGSGLPVLYAEPILTV